MFQLEDWMDESSELNSSNWKNVIELWNKVLEEQKIEDS